jgi:hypothetical protein
MEISLQSYSYFAFYYMSIALFVWAFLILMPDYHQILTAWFFLQCIEVIDYFLTYNTNWVTVDLNPTEGVLPLGISITFVKFTVLAILIIRQWT